MLAISGGTDACGMTIKNSTENQNGKTIINLHTSTVNTQWTIYKHYIDLSDLDKTLLNKTELIPRNNNVL